ncbi:hypothetical protein ScalyP_jg9674 [Parmales sp. scaly parma]|nr:hypothetical protein ScalyP_jg9674 [Parmales sp. scaly parma]
MFLLIAILLRFLQAKSFVVKKTANRPFTFKRNLWYDSSSSSKRRQVIAGNWKCNPSTYPEAKALLKLLTTNVKSMGSSAPDIIIFPPAPFLSSALTLTEGSGIQIGAQDVSLVTGGAFTGETSASMLRTLGCDFVLVGHSERRTLYDESDATINSKVKLCLAQQGLKVILCVGETLDEFQQELLENVVSLQVKKGLAGVSAGDCERIVIAYEPVWAIGTGEVATPEQAQNAHVVARHALFDLHGERTSREVRILYGGSVNPETIDRLMGMPDVDGGLGGGLLLGGEDAILTMSENDREATVLRAPPAEFNTRPNDGRVDREGRMVMGMYNNYHRAGSSAGDDCAELDELFITSACRPTGGALYRLKMPFGISGLPEPEWGKI